MYQRKIGNVREASLHWQLKVFGRLFRHQLHYKKWCLMPKTKAIINIQNIVASANLNQKVDLNAVVKSYPGVEYRPELFPGLVFRLKRPKTTTLIFSAGKMICTGAKSEKESRSAVMKVAKELKKNGIIIINKPDLKVVNIVASASLGGKVDLEKAVTTLGKAMYEPEQFPGLIYRMDEPKVVILIFASGSLVCTGAKKEQDVYDAVHKLHEILEEQNLIFYE
jgi:transcription initiation factor TFIID TATA-box-binding protein